jgi:hypothetical protein
MNKLPFFAFSVFVVAVISHIGIASIYTCATTPYRDFPCVSDTSCTNLDPNGVTVNDNCSGGTIKIYATKCDPVVDTALPGNPQPLPPKVLEGDPVNCGTNHIVPDQPACGVRKARTTTSGSVCSWPYDVCGSQQVAVVCP